MMKTYSKVLCLFLIVCAGPALCATVLPFGCEFSFASVSSSGGVTNLVGWLLENRGISPSQFTRWIETGEGLETSIAASKELRQFQKAAILEVLEKDPSGIETARNELGTHAEELIRRLEEREDQRTDDRHHSRWLVHARLLGEPKEIGHDIASPEFKLGKDTLRVRQLAGDLFASISKSIEINGSQELLYLSSRVDILPSLALGPGMVDAKIIDMGTDLLLVLTHVPSNGPGELMVVSQSKGVIARENVIGTRAIFDTNLKNGRLRILLQQAGRTSIIATLDLGKKSKFKFDPFEDPTSVTHPFTGNDGSYMVGTIQLFPEEKVSRDYPARVKVYLPESKKEYLIGELDTKVHKPTDVPRIHSVGTKGGTYLAVEHIKWDGGTGNIGYLKLYRVDHADLKSGKISQQTPKELELPFGIRGIRGITSFHSMGREYLVLTHHKGLVVLDPEIEQVVGNIEVASRETVVGLRIEEQEDGHIYGYFQNTVLGRRKYAEQKVQLVRLPPTK